MHLGFHGIGRNGKEVFRKVFDCRRLGIICSFEITLSPIFLFLFYFLCKPGVPLIDPYRSLRDRFVYARFGLLQCDKYREITKATEYRIKNIVMFCSGKRMKLILLSSFYFDFARIMFQLCNGVERIKLDVISEHRKKGTGNSDRYLNAHTSEIYIYILYIYLLLTFKQN